jgi:hypothetical protein
MGGTEMADFYEATLSIPKPSPRVPAFSFPTIQIAVVDRWRHEHSMLGLDALRKVLLFSVEKRVFLLPPELLVVPANLALPERVSGPGSLSR